MAIDVMLTLAVAALTTAMAYGGRRATWRALAVVLVVAVLGSVLAARLSGNAYPWSNALALATAWSAGALLGRASAKWFWPVVVVLAALDVASFAAAAQTASARPGNVNSSLFANVTVLWASGHFREGLLDVAVLCAFALRWARTWTIPAVFALGSVASLSPFAVVLAGWRGGLPLLPFFASVGALSAVTVRSRVFEPWAGVFKRRSP